MHLLSPLNLQPKLFSIPPKITVPVSYQGSKQRLSHHILDLIDYAGGRFYDLGCGSGAIAIELVNRGVPPDQITMVDHSPWGLFWGLVGRGEFDLDMFGKLCRLIPRNQAEISRWVQQLAGQTVPKSNAELACKFLILQAASFGGKAVWTDGDKWIHHSFRTWWQPTPHSKRRSPSNPMSPMPETLYARVRDICTVMRGVNGLQTDATAISLRPGSTVYVDPPYQGTLEYGYNLDWRRVIRMAESAQCRVFVSERISLGENAYRLLERKRGAVTGLNQNIDNNEWVTVFDFSSA